MAYLGKVLIISLHHKGHMGYEDLPQTEDDSAATSKHGSFMEEAPMQISLCQVSFSLSLIFPTYFQGKDHSSFCTSVGI